MSSRTIGCPDCNGVVSRSAEKCPHCGRRMKMDPTRAVILLLLILAGIAAVASALHQSQIVFNP